jgi:predicted Zn finger-like uncharacterized protein
MVILCPQCSTGFNLPEKHITPRGAKLRCSRCSHVFRVRSGADAPEIFYKPEDEAANAAHAEEQSAQEVKSYAAPARSFADDDDDDDDRVQALGGATRMGVGAFEQRAAAPKMGGFGDGLSEVSSPNHKTQFGAPNLAEVSSPNHKTQFGAAGFAAARGDDEPGTMDLGPHLASAPQLNASTQFGPGSIAATREKSSPNLPTLGKIGGALAKPPLDGPGQTLEWRGQKKDPTPKGLDLFGGDDDEMSDAFDGPDPFAGAFELSSSAALHKEKKKPRSMLFDEPEADAEPEENILRAGRGVGQRPAPVDDFVQRTAHADPAPSTPLRAAALPDDVPEPSVDLSGSSSAFWDDGGVDDKLDASDMVDPSFGKDGPAFDPMRGVVEPSGAPVQAPRPAPRQPAPPQLASAGQAAQHAAPRVAAAAPALAAPAPHQIGGSGPQKVANIALIVLAVLFLFFSLIAVRNDMLLDFKQFGNMLGVAFGGDAYTPRPEWLGEEAAPPAADGKPGPATKPKVVKEPLEVRGVWASVAPWTRKKEALVVRGSVQNHDMQDYVDVRVRVLVVDEQDRAIAEAEGPIGAWITDAQIKALGPAKQPKTLMPESPTRLTTSGSQPFTIIFDEVPKQVEEGAQVGYRVEFTKKVGERDLSK